MLCSGVVVSTVISQQQDTSFLLQSKNMYVRFIGDSTLTILKESMSVYGCLYLCDPAIDWRPVQDVSASHPVVAWIVIF